MLRDCWGLCLALVLLLLPNWLLDRRVQGQRVITALRGSQAHLSFRDLGSYQELTWFLWSGRSISKVVIWEHQQGAGLGSSGNTHYYQSQLQGRVCLDNSTLHIWDLRAGDGRNYTLRVLRPDGTQEERTLRLQVLDPVSTPDITVHGLRLKDSYCFLNLTCSTSSPLATLSISWKGSTGSLAPASPGGVLKVAAKEMPVTYTCNARDALSSRESSVTFKQCVVLSSGELVSATWLLVLVPLILQTLLC